MNTEDSIELTKLSIAQNRCTMPEKYVSMKRYYRMPEKIFVKEDKIVVREFLGNCVFCKISILLLILLSFIVVRPTKNQEIVPAENLNTVQVSSETIELSVFEK